ncbi:MAG: helix-turn-helix domain-containing protein [Cytophagales bacterium]|nr:helix-turn-helix domain-containing protein [Cytophagales bacterium]
MKQDNSDDSKYIIPNLQNALELIELISEYLEGLNLPKLVQMTKVPKSTIFRICSTLLTNGYLATPSYGSFGSSVNIRHFSERHICGERLNPI